MVALATAGAPASTSIERRQLLQRARMLAKDVCALTGHYPDRDNRCARCLSDQAAIIRDALNNSDPPPQD